mmetsp:Transcript_56873/g.123027  ORF Transcript_56873/g.123027 Transcript_56873/m.123027 type:complete len:332 (+) Transcript_56873:55-1050(+)
MPKALRAPTTAAVAAGAATLCGWSLVGGFVPSGRGLRGGPQDRTADRIRAHKHGRASEARRTGSTDIASLIGPAVLTVAGGLALRSRASAQNGQEGRRTACAAQWQAPSMAEEPSPQRKDEPKPSAPPIRMPMIDTGSGTIDVMSRLLQDRVLILSGQVNDEMANVLIAQMLYLANRPEDKDKDITIYINSPGGSVSAGMAIFDSMQFVPCDVSTVCFGMAASMGAFLLGAGTKGKRKCLPNARVMIHQPLGGAGGQAADIEIQAKEILFLRELLNTYLSDFTGKSLDQIATDCDRDYFMTPEESVEYGIIDAVVETKSWPRLQKPPKPSI